MKSTAFKRSFYYNGYQHSMITRRNRLAGYALSRNGRICRYVILDIYTQNGTGFEMIAGHDDASYFDTYAEFIERWDVMIQKQELLTSKTKINDSKN